MVEYCVRLVLIDSRTAWSTRHQPPLLLELYSPKLCSWLFLSKVDLGPEALLASRRTSTSSRWKSLHCCRARYGTSSVLKQNSCRAIRSWNLRWHPRQRAHCYSLPWRRCDCTSHFSHFRRYTSKMFSRFLPLPAFAARASFWPYTCGHSTSSSHTDGIRISQMFGKRRLVDVPKCRPIRFRYTRRPSS